MILENRRSNNFSLVTGGAAGFDVLEDPLLER
jgi:hypothetical protein